LLKQCPNYPRESLDPSQETLSSQQMKKYGKGTSIVLTNVQFDVDVRRQALARMVVVNKLSFKFFEGGGFHFFISFLHLKCPISGRITIAKDCWNL